MKRYNRMLNILLIILLGSTILFPTGKVSAATAPPETYSESIIVMDVETEEILYNKNGFARNMIASTSKVMTAILAYELLEPDELVTIGEKPPYALGSSMGFRAGEEVRAEDLIYALMLHSANDAAEALAEAIDGSVEKFAERMTQRAHDIGAVDTVFHNPSGLADTENLENSNFTTARDLSLILKEVTKHPGLMEIGKKLSHMLPMTNLQSDTNRWAGNKNKMLHPTSQYYYEPVLFGKTGWTPEAGYSWTSLAEKDGRMIIVTMLRAVNQDTYWKETKSLMEWAFSETKVHTLYEQGQLIKNALLSNGESVPLYAKEDFHWVTGVDEQPVPLLQFDEQTIDKDYEAGETVNTAKVLLNNEEIGTIDLVCEESIKLIASEEEEKDPLSGNSGEDAAFFSKHPVLKVLSILFGSITILFLLLLAFGTVMRRRRRRLKQKRMSSKRVAYLKQLEETRR